MYFKVLLGFSFFYPKYVNVLLGFSSFIWTVDLMELKIKCIQYCHIGTVKHFKVIKQIIGIINLLFLSSFFINRTCFRFILIFMIIATTLASRMHHIFNSAFKKNQAFLMIFSFFLFLGKSS